MKHEFGICLSDLAKEGPLGRTALTREVKEGRLEAKKYGKKVIITPLGYERFLESLPNAATETE